ncbi:helix-turn-helix transcriptional regulator [Enterovibrio norvegicus]|uniref:helix-turn-helix domain-containing protein n=1 Tax=Enterovibrio norvegicus TaxID=188144 RepID=UPI0010BF0286|nr:helix-turn-helix transcriptional regulator [Enterovibrio norvegicus]TKF13719.1 helix-turn-helix transcriptional regulator [Enterovibrio norvegicus]
MNFSKTLEKCRQYRNLSKKELADKVGKSPSYITLLEQGKREPNFGLVEDLCRALDIPVSVFMFLASQENDLPFSDELTEKIENLIYQLIDDSNS